MSEWNLAIVRTLSINVGINAGINAGINTGINAKQVLMQRLFSIQSPVINQ